MSTTYKMAVVGAGGVGKSALTIQFTTNRFVHDHDPTIQENFKQQIVLDKQPCTLDILDTAGQEEFKAMRHEYMRLNEGFLLVFDVTRPESFEKEVREFHTQIRQIKDADMAPIILVGNKCDLAESRKISGEQGQSLAAELEIPFIETSAKTDSGVNDAFHTLIRMMRAKHIAHKKNGSKHRHKRSKCSIA